MRRKKQGRDVEQKEWISGFVIAVLTLLFSQGVPALLRLLNIRSGDKKTQAVAEAKGYNAVIVRLDARVEALEEEIVRLRTELEIADKAHFDCRVEYAALRVEFDQLKRQIER